MNYAKKISLKPDIYIVDLPKKTGDIFLDIVLKSGYAEEGEKEFGTGHLLEHYLISSLWDDMRRNNIEANAEISLEMTKHYVKIRNIKELKNLKLFLKNIFKPDFSNENIFKKEKKAITNELAVKIASFHERIDAAAEKERFKGKCRYARDRKTQLKSILNKSLKDLEKYHGEFYTENNVFFLVSGYKISKKVTRQIVEGIKNIDLHKKPADKKTCDFSCAYSNFKIKKIKEKISKQILLALSFPGLTVKNSYKERFLSRIIGRLLSATQEGIMAEVRDLGIYDVRYEEATLKKAGYIGFGTALEKKQLDGFLKLFSGKIKELKIKGVEERKLKKIVADMKKSSRRSFENNNERAEWVAYDLAVYGRVITPTDDWRILDSVKNEDVKKWARKILDRKKMNVIIVGDKIKNISNQKIRGALFT